MKRHCLEVSYDGTAFHGSQIQGDTATVQFELNLALSTLLREQVETFGASRTDEGVHALCNFYHFDSGRLINRHTMYQLNAILPPAVSVRNIYKTSEEFNARFDALSRRYRYRIYRQKNPFLFQRALYLPFRLDHEVLQQTAGILKEYTDFETFSKRNAQTKTFLCHIKESYWETQGEELHYIVTANRFLRGMVRGLVGTQLRAGRGKYDVTEFRRIVESKDCRLADFSPKGWGLYLEHIEYPAGSMEAL